MYYLGIDGGGTRSRLVVSDRSGNVCGRYEGATTNIAANSEQVVKAHVTGLVTQFFKEKGVSYEHCAGVCIGSAGIDTPAYAGQMERILGAIGFDCPLRAVNDAELILWAEMKAEAGIALIAGTGSIAYGKNAAGTVKRCGGWGHLFDDRGSGYWIAREAVASAFRYHDGRGEKTVLKALLQEHFGRKEFEDILHDLYHDEFKKHDLAALAVMVSEAAEQGDRVSRNILEAAAGHLLELVSTLMGRLDLPGDCRLLWSGGSLQYATHLRECFISGVSQISPEIQISQTGQDPVMGALYLSRKLNIM